MEFQYAVGATPFDPDEAVGLVPVHITTQADLNAWEQVNIALGERWGVRQKRRELLDEGFLRDLHRQMFDKTWKWAGTFRRSNKNIGVDSCLPQRKRPPCTLDGRFIDHAAWTSSIDLGWYQCGAYIGGETA